MSDTHCDRPVYLMNLSEVETEMDAIIEADGDTGHGRFIQLRERRIELVPSGNDEN